MKEKRSRSAPPVKRFAFYHQNEALLFQFLLYECMRAQQTLRKKPDATLLLQIMGKVESRVESWHAPLGHLPKLLHYCSLLATHFDTPPSPLCKNLEQTLQRAYAVAKECHAALERDVEGLSKLYTLLRKEMRTFMKLLFEKLHDFCDNAAVLFFLLRHQEQFDALYREPIIKKKFHLFFPEGVKQAQGFLIEKFSKKGFNHLIPYIEQRLQNLAPLHDLQKTKKNEK
jgi:hypothetical protein